MITATLFVDDMHVWLRAVVAGTPVSIHQRAERTGGRKKERAEREREREERRRREERTGRITETRD